MSALSPLALAALERARASIPSPRPISSRRSWSEDEEQLLIQLYPNTPMPQLIQRFGRDDKAIYNKAKSLGLKRSTEYLASEHACRLRKGDNVGAAHRFKPGNRAWNKGMKGLQIGGEATRFRKGNKPQTWVPVGTEQIRDGYLWRKVTDHGGRFDWKQVHVMLWEQHHGPVPKGLILVFLDRNRQNIQLDNLELITRAELCRRNSIHRYPPEVKELIRLQKKLEREIRKKADEEQDD
jgi:hypothetical protein